MRTADLVVLLYLSAALGAHGPAHAQLPERVGDFTLKVVTNDVPYARQMAEADDGTLFVGSLRQGQSPYTRLYAVVPVEDGDAEVVVVDESLFYPSGVVLAGPDLYVAALNRVLRYPNILETFRDNPEPTVITSSLPTDTHHGWKYLSIGPDGHLYVPVGAPCNICEEADERYATILRMDPDTGQTTVYAHGVRNSVGMAWHPVTGELWFSENGRDWLDDDLPADEINRVETPGGHYGFPYVHQDHRRGKDDYPDPIFGVGKNPDDYLRSEHLIQAHSAALGMTFYTGDQFPSRYCGAMFISEHGSWNRYAAGKAGYRVSVLRFANPDTPRGAGAVYEPFLDVWLNQQTQRHTGRPNDVVVSRDGSLLIADDFARSIYRVSYAPENPDLNPITGCADTSHVSTFAPASHATRQGFARIVNHGETEATVRMDAFNDGGQRSGPVNVTVGGGKAVHFNSTDLEDGNPDKTWLSGSVGSGSGDWRIELRADAVQVLSYMRTQDGFVTSLHDVAPLLEPVSVTPQGNLEHRYHVPIFNPGRNTDQVSWLRLVNPGEVAAQITITGIDTTGTAAENPAILGLAGRASRSISAQDLESGAGLIDERGLDAGAGKWRLVVTSDRPILVASLLASPTGHLTNLSTVPDNQVTDGTGTTYFLPLFPGHGDAKDRQGFVRIVNRSDQTGSVTVSAGDDTDRVFGTFSLDLAAQAAVHFNSEDLETGDEDKGIPEGIGAGEGDWRLTLASDLDLDVLAYIRRTSDGFLTSMHDFVRRRGDGTYEVPFFNPGRNIEQVSLLRILNTGDERASVTIRGIDGDGQTTDTVQLSVPGGTARTLSSQQLEASGDDFTGLGTGTGKWRLIVTSEQPVRVMSLLESPTGHLTNLSTVPASY